MNTKGKIVAVVLVILVVGAVVLLLQPFSTQVTVPQTGEIVPTSTTPTIAPTATSTATTSISDLIQVTSPKEDA